MKKYYLLSVKNKVFSFRFKALLFFILVFGIQNNAVSQTNLETVKSENHSHAEDKELFIESLLPIEKYFSIISKVENNNNIYNTERNYFHKFVQKDISTLRLKALNDHESKNLILLNFLMNLLDK
ncbi:MAG: hypothetical protein IPG89_16050 [Bacteroidetes bacterium]|nr:hypothetical protein [Bacteroidota bacterium]